VRRSHNRVDHYGRITLLGIHIDQYAAVVSPAAAVMHSVPADVGLGRDAEAALMRIYTQKKVAKFSILLLLGTTLLLVNYSSYFTKLVVKIASSLVRFKSSKTNTMTRDAVKHVSNEAATSIPAAITVEAAGNFAERVRQFNVQLSGIRRRAWRSRGFGEWKDLVHSEPVQVLWGARDDYLDVLATKYPHVTTVILPWTSTGERVWNSLTDTVNVPRQTYYEWTADNTLCTWIETPGVIRMKYDAMFNRTCVHNIDATFLPRTLQPVFLNAKPLRQDKYWPNDGSAYPAHFYTSPPPFVFYMHIHRDAIVTVNGDVYSGNLKLVLDACSHDTQAEVPAKVDQMPLYDEVLVITQYWGTAVFHRMAEIVPRIVFYREFLRDNPQIRVVAPELPGGRLSELFRIISVDDMRLVVGPVRAKVVYQPRSSKCGMANVQESQTLSSLYREHISRTFSPQSRNRLVLIRRTTNRRFTEQGKIEELLKQAARNYNLTYTVFPDNATPSLNDTMMIFHSAVIIVAPVGAGESNMFFSQPGTYVVEGVCNLPHVNLCFQRLAHILGHHWHGVTSRGGCEEVVDVSAASVEDAVRNYLRLWRLERSS